jgi:hypothetical protein
MTAPPNIPIYYEAGSPSSLLAKKTDQNKSAGRDNDQAED